jgi:two-component system, NarL family, sensor histidine kinase UhpB
VHPHLLIQRGRLRNEKSLPGSNAPYVQHRRVKTPSQRAARVPDTRAAFRRLARWQRDMLENEQSRLSGELHDQIGQSLTGLTMDLVMLRARISKLLDGAPPQMLLDPLASMRALIDEMIAIARGMSRRLRPSVLDNFGLVAALEWFATDSQQRHGIRCEVANDGKVGALPAELATAAYRIVTRLLDDHALSLGMRDVRVRIAREADLLHITLSSKASLNTADPPQTLDAEPDMPFNSVRAVALLDTVERARDAGGHVSVLPGETGVIANVTLPLPS